MIVQPISQTGKHWSRMLKLLPFPSCLGLGLSPFHPAVTPPGRTTCKLASNLWLESRASPAQPGHKSAPHPDPPRWRSPHARGAGHSRVPAPRPLSRGGRRREGGVGGGERARPRPAHQAPAGEGGGGDPSWHKETLLKTENRANEVITNRNVDS